MSLPNVNTSSTLRNHRRQSLLQIWLPMLLGTLVFFAAMVWLISSLMEPGAGGLRGSADAAAVWIVLPWLLWSLLGILLLTAMIVLVIVLKKKLPVAGEKVLDYFLKARQMMKTGSDATAKPIIAIQEWAAKANQVSDSFRQRFIKGKQQ